ncbi:hypothetical protein JD844_010022 [Phrynosoma platyrhinos]|uniref:C19orf38 Ig domain-containing protein n=1 Tax=Phrynosoma platyrhinos TaxID=52577 RepID=A0ABQ7TGT6_PHRPL|nr:hypothetical protein JD844_010022 [Phrynosoma platyrhinos]
MRQSTKSPPTCLQTLATKPVLGFSMASDQGARWMDRQTEIDGSLGASSLFPHPLIFLNVLSDGLREGDSIKIACLAPMAYMDAWFYLYKVDQAQPFQVLPAAETQHQVDFHLENITTRDGGQYRCQYGQYNGSQLQLSELSFILEVTVEGSRLITSAPTDPPGSGSEVKERRQKKRVLDSCWTETSYPETETSFDNCMFTVSVKNSGQEAVENQGTFSFTAMGTRFSSVKSIGKPDFSTFRASE